MCRLTLREPWDLGKFAFALASAFRLACALALWCAAGCGASKVSEIGSHGDGKMGRVLGVGSARRGDKMNERRNGRKAKSIR